MSRHSSLFREALSCFVTISMLCCDVCKSVLYVSNIFDRCLLQQSTGLTLSHKLALTKTSRFSGSFFLSKWQRQSSSNNFMSAATMLLIWSFNLRVFECSLCLTPSHSHSYNCFYYFQPIYYFSQRIRDANGRSATPRILRFHPLQWAEKSKIPKKHPTMPGRKLIPNFWTGHSKLWTRSPRSNSRHSRGSFHV